MRISMFSLAALVGLSACGPGTDAVWLFTFEQGEVTRNETTCLTNFTTSSCPETDDPGDPGPWTSTVDQTVSDGAFFGQILDGPNGDKVLVVDGELYVGQKDGGSWIFEWNHFEDSTNELTHEVGYMFSAVVNASTTQTITLDMSGGTATGTMSSQRDTTETVTESDAWLAEDVGFEFGRIIDQAPVYLEGDRVNYNQDSDCNGNDCMIEASLKQDWSAPIVAMRTDAGRDGYEGVSGATREPGKYDN